MGNRNGGALNNYDGSASEKNSTINQLLSEMDGFSSSEMVMVIGSTNKL
jgi:ATP-dependent Zn protease